MTRFTNLLAAAAAIGALAAPAAAQYYQQYPQQYPQYPQQTYPGQPGYGQYPNTQYPNTQYPYGQNYGYNQGTGNPVTDIIDQLLGNRYSVTDRQAVRQCANAARAQAAQQYGAYGNNNYPYGQGYGQGYNSGYAGRLHVTAINSVERRSNGLRIRGMLGTSGGYGAYGNQGGGQYGYQNRGYAAGDLSFRCNVDYRGVVTDLRVRPGNG